MTQKDIFSEFISLDWKEKSRNINRPEKDIVLGEYVVARVNNTGCAIHYLTNGNIITIPKLWLDIFSVLNTHSGARIIRLGETGDNVEKTIYLMLLTVLYLDINRGSDVLEVLGKIAEIRTTEFRNWVKIKHDIELPEITLITPDSIVEI